MGRDTLELAFDSLFIAKIKRVFPAADAERLVSAYTFSLKRTGHHSSVSLHAADLLIGQDADATTVTCALLAPLLWQGLTDLSEIQNRFGETVSTALKGLKSQLIFRSHTHQYRREDIQSFLKSIGNVPHKALLYIVFRLLALENTGNNHEIAFREMAQETLDFYVPIANRLSLGKLRRRLEDACFQTLDPVGYAHLKERVSPIQAEDDKCLEILLAGVRRLLKSNGIKGRVQGRTKSLHGIHRKMMRLGKPLEEIMDRVGLRIIVSSVPECYAVLGLLHSHFKPIPGTFDDYIGLPKDNGYQSLHTCVYPVREISHKPIEFQMRTELMHMEAEHGTAAHWRYKNETMAKIKNRFHTQWMEGLAHQYETADSAEAFIEQLHRQVFRDNLVVFGNGGRIVRLAEKATVRDYLRIANVPLPEGAVVKVNGKTAMMGQTLREGDSIEVLDRDALNGNPAKAGGTKTEFHDIHQPVLPDPFIDDGECSRTVSHSNP